MLYIKQSISQCLQCFNFLSRKSNDITKNNIKDNKDNIEYKKINNNNNEAWDNNEWNDDTDTLSLNIETTELTKQSSSSSNNNNSNLLSPSTISVNSQSINLQPNLSIPPPKSSSPVTQQNILPPRPINPVPVRKPIQPVKEVPVEPEVPDVDYFEQYNLKPQTAVTAKKVSRVVPSMVANNSTNSVVEKSSKLNMEIVEDDIGVWGDIDIPIKVEKEKKVKEDRKKKIAALLDDDIDIIL